MNPIYSIIIPCYNEEDCLDETYRRLIAVMGGMGEKYELVFVNDGSRDKTPLMLDELAGRDARVKVVHFARNGGHQIAVTAGMDYATGEALVIIDADLQDPPEVIPRMAKLWKEGAQVVYGQRKSRAGETWMKEWTAKHYYKLLGRLAGNAFPRDTGDFRLVDKKVADVVRSMPEHARYLRGMFAWAGFKQVALPYDRDKRFAGVTHYPLKKMLRLAANGVISFSDKPLHWPLWAGLLFLLAVAGMVAKALLFLILGKSIQGLWLPLLICLGFGLTLSAIGVVGAYLARVYEEVKGRPLYVVARTVGFDQAGEPVPLPPGTRKRS